MEKEFNAVNEHVPAIQVNMTAAREHVGETEREIRTLKERTRLCTTGEFPFETIPITMLEYTVYNIVLWLNTSPIRSGTTVGFSSR